MNILVRFPNPLACLLFKSGGDPVYKISLLVCWPGSPWWYTRRLVRFLGGMLLLAQMLVAGCNVATVEAPSLQLLPSVIGCCSRRANKQRKRGELYESKEKENYTKAPGKKQILFGSKEKRMIADVKVCLLLLLCSILHMADTQSNSMLKILDYKLL